MKDTSNIYSIYLFFEILSNLDLGLFYFCSVALIVKKSVNKLKTEWNYLSIFLCIRDKIAVIFILFQIIIFN